MLVKINSKFHHNRLDIVTFSLEQYQKFNSEKNLKSNIYTKGVQTRGLIKASILTYKLTLLQCDVYDLYECVVFRSHINFFQHQLCFVILFL